MNKITTKRRIHPAYKDIINALKILKLKMSLEKKAYKIMKTTLLVLTALIIFISFFIWVFGQVLELKSVL